MSCFILKNELVAAIATMFSVSIHRQNNPYGIYNNYALGAAISHKWQEMTGMQAPFYLDDKIIYQVLRYFNEEAYSERYGEPVPGEIEEMPKGEWCSLADTSPWQMLKVLQCYNYQCDEKTTCNTVLYAALREAERYFMQFLVNTIPEYNDAVWSWESE